VRRVVCPGSFDPVTNGHLDIISRAAGLYDEVIVAVLINVTKHSLFTVDERVEMLSQVTSNYGNVKIERFHGPARGLLRGQRDQRGDQGVCGPSATSSTRCRWRR